MSSSNFLLVNTTSPTPRCAILDRSILGAELTACPSSQITVRGWFSKGESQLEMKTSDLYTKDQASMISLYYRKTA